MSAERFDFIGFDFRHLAFHFSTIVLASEFYKLRVPALVEHDFDFKLLVLLLLAAAVASNFYKYEVILRVHVLLVVSTQARFWISHSINHR